MRAASGTTLFCVAASGMVRAEKKKREREDEKARKTN